MHKSRLCYILIDCGDEKFEANVNFWGGALGMKSKYPADLVADPYVGLDGTVGELNIALQKVNDASRIHLDIETDNVEAEVQRLEKLGATRHTKVSSWWIMRDPAGNYFCVVPVQTKDFAEKAHVWE